MNNVFFKFKPNVIVFKPNVIFFNSSRISNAISKSKIQNSKCHMQQYSRRKYNQKMKRTLQTIKNHILNITKVRHKRPILIVRCPIVKRWDNITSNLFGQKRPIFFTTLLWGVVTIALAHRITGRSSTTLDIQKGRHLPHGATTLTTIYRLYLLPYRYMISIWYIIYHHIIGYQWYIYDIISYIH